MHTKWSAFVAMFALLGTTACSSDPETAKRHYLAEGNRYLAEKKYSEAILEYRNALKHDPKFGEARLKLTDAYLDAGDARNALAESVRAADVLPDNVDAQVRAGSLLLLARQFPDAKARALVALAKDPKDARAMVLLGNALANLKDLDGAIEQMEQAIDADPQLTLTYSNLGELFLAKGDKESAEAAFRRGVDAAPQSAVAHLGVANFLWSGGNREGAERELKRALELEPRSADVNRALATFYTVQNRPADAEAYLKTYAEVTATVESRLLLADHYVRMAKIPDATSVLSTLAKEKLGFAPASMRLAAIDFAAGRRQDAYQELENVLKQAPKNEGALQQKARFLLADGKYSDALAIANSLVAANSQSVANQFLRGQALEAAGSLDEAIAAYLDTLKTSPTLVSSKIRLATVYLRQADPKDALMYAQQVVQATPQPGSAHLLYAQALVKSGDLPAAERELLMLAKAVPSSADVHAWLGMLYESKRDWTRARASYQQAYEIQPNNIGALAGLMSIDFSENKSAAALARIEARVAERPSDATLLSMRALAYLTARDLPKAEAAYRKVLEVAPQNMDAYERLGVIYLAQNRLDEARKSFEELARQQRKPVAAETMLGMILVQQNKADDARKHFERALEIDPHAVVAANNLAWDYASNGGNLDVALQLAQTAKAGLPDNASITDTLGWIYYKKGLLPLAVSTLRQGVQQDAANPTIHYHLGLAYLQQGNKEEARKSLERALRLNPRFASADDAKRALATAASNAVGS